MPIFNTGNAFLFVLLSMAVLTDCPQSARQLESTFIGRIHFIMYDYINYYSIKFFFTF